MSETQFEPTLASGLILLDADAIDRLPEEPAVYRLRSSGQRVMYVGHAGDEGLREAVREAYGHSPIAGVALLEYRTVASAAEAEAAAAADIDHLKPLYNLGFGRYRNDDTGFPTKGHQIRKAIHNP